MTADRQHRMGRQRLLGGDLSRLITLVTAGLALIACGSSTTSSSGASSSSSSSSSTASASSSAASSSAASSAGLHLCTVVPTADVAAAVHRQPLTTAESLTTPAPGYSYTTLGCNYTAADGTLACVLYVEQYDSASAAMTAFNVSQSGGAASPVPGVGDTAYFTTIEISMIHVLHGSNVIKVGVTVPNGVDDLTAAKTIAQALLGRF